MSRDVQFRGATSREGLVLLVADVISYTPTITERHREILVEALRYSLRAEVTVEDEERFFEAMLDAGMQVTPAFDPKHWHWKRPVS